MEPKTWPSLARKTYRDILTTQLAALNYPKTSSVHEGARYILENLRLKNRRALAGCREAVSAACIFVALRNNAVDVTVADLARKFGADLKVMRKTLGCLERDTGCTAEGEVSDSVKGFVIGE